MGLVKKEEQGKMRDYPEYSQLVCVQLMWCVVLLYPEFHVIPFSFPIVCRPSSFDKPVIISLFLVVMYCCHRLRINFIQLSRLTRIPCSISLSNWEENQAIIFMRMQCPVQCRACDQSPMFNSCVGCIVC